MHKPIHFPGIILIQWAVLAPLLTGVQPGVLAADLELAGITVTPHCQSAEMRYRREPDFSLGARVEFFLQNSTRETLQFGPKAPIKVRDKSPDQLVDDGDWAWHDFPCAWTNAPLSLPPGALTVWSFNGNRAPWGLGTSAILAVGNSDLKFDITEPQAWLSAVTFLSSTTNPFPDSMVLHVANQTRRPLRLESCRLWLPKDNLSWRVLLPQPWLTNLNAFPAGGSISAGDRGGARVATGVLPLTYTALEVRLRTVDGELLTLWTHLRIKAERFDISGGWVASKIGNSNALQLEPFLKTLRRMHVNTAHIADTPGYTDQTGPSGLYTRYPLKYFNKLQPFEHYDTEAMLPRIHAVEFLGEPQYGGGRPVPPMHVWRALAPYAATRLPTSVTHSEERIWRFYAGLSDYPHYDAYRVSSPSADEWSRYDRWGGKKIRWGAPLETIGDMTMSLRELNRPRPIAYWSQGAGDGWEVYGGRQRTSPTPDELRAQAYHALAQRITSLYWFNLSLKSLVKFPDLIKPMTLVGREIRLLEDFYLEGDAFYFHRRTSKGKPDWELAVVAGPRGAVCFALDLAYVPDPTEKVFNFGPPRQANLDFLLPSYLQQPAEVLRVDAEQVRQVAFKNSGNGISLAETCGPVNVFVALPRSGLAGLLEAQRQSLIKFEESFGFDPGLKTEDLEQLRQLIKR